MKIYVPIMLNCVTQSTDFQFLQIFETAESDYTSRLDLHFIENLTIWEGDKTGKKSLEISKQLL